MKERLLYDLCYWLVNTQIVGLTENLAAGYAEYPNPVQEWYAVENMLPATPDNLICVAERKSGGNYGYDITGGIQRRAVEFIVRSKTLETAFIRCQRIYDAIEHSNRKIWLNDEKKFCLIVPKDLPYKSGQDVNSRHEVSLLCVLSTKFDVR